MEVLLDCPIVIGQYDKVSDTATTDLPIDEHILDELVPPPGPWWRRVLGWVSFLGIVGVLAWTIISGTVVPHASIVPESWGGTGPVSVTAAVKNDSRVDIEVVAGPRARLGLSSIGYATGTPTDAHQPSSGGSNPFPLRVAPGKTLQITSWYRVTDCRAIKAISRNDDEIDFQVRIADGPASWITAERSSRDQMLGWIGADLDGDQKPGKSTPLHQESWAAGIAEFACKN